jgi:hypothetical protein
MMKVLELGSWYFHSSIIYITESQRSRVSTEQRSDVLPVSCQCCVLHFRTVNVPGFLPYSFSAPHVIVWYMEPIFNRLVYIVDYTSHTHIIFTE